MAYEVSESLDITSFGLFGSVDDAVKGIALFILSDMSGVAGLHDPDAYGSAPWGDPRREDEFDWGAAEEWLSTYTEFDLVEWYRKAFPDIRVVIEPIQFMGAPPDLNERGVVELGEDYFRFVGQWWEGVNLLPGVLNRDVSESSQAPTADTAEVASPDKQGPASPANPAEFRQVGLINSSDLFDAGERWMEIDVADLDITSGVIRVYGSSWSSFGPDGDVLDEFDEEMGAHSLVCISEEVSGLHLWSWDGEYSWIGKQKVEECTPVSPLDEGCRGGRYVVGVDLPPGPYLLMPGDSGKMLVRMLDQRLRELPQPATYTPPGESRQIEIGSDVYAIEFRGLLRPGE